jgi:hypothetical protein
MKESTLSKITRIAALKFTDRSARLGLKASWANG